MRCPSVWNCHRGHAIRKWAYRNYAFSHWLVNLKRKFRQIRFVYYVLLVGYWSSLLIHYLDALFLESLTVFSRFFDSSLVLLLRLTVLLQLIIISVILPFVLVLFFFWILFLLNCLFFPFIFTLLIFLFFLLLSYFISWWTLLARTLMLLLNEISHPFKRSLLFLLFIEFLNFIKVEFMLALWTKMVQIFYNPLSNALFMEDMLAWQQNSLFHILVTYSTSQVMELLKLFSF